MRHLVQEGLEVRANCGHWGSSHVQEKYDILVFHRLIIELSQ